MRVKVRSKPVDEVYLKREVRRKAVESKMKYEQNKVVESIMD